MSDETILLMHWSAKDDAELERDEFPDARFQLCRGNQAPANGHAADAVITYSATERVAPAAPAFARCRIAIRGGVGYDNLDLAGWASRGVPVCNVPDYGTTEVADHAIALMLALARGTATYHDDLLHARPWAYAAAPLIRRLRGATFGVVGLGRIGLATARRASAFDMRVVFYDPYLPSGAELAVGYERIATLAALMAESDVVSMHAPLTEETRGLIGEAALAAAKPGLIVVNTARGPIIDLDALTDALRGGRIGGAALDVLPREPADPEHPLITAWRGGAPWVHGRLTLSPHAAFYSPTSEADQRRKSVQTALAFLREGRLRNCVNAHLLPAAQSTVRS